MLNLRNFRIGARLMMTTVGALALMIVFVTISLLSLNAISDKVDRIANNNIKTTELAVGMRTRALQIGTHVRTALLFEEIEKQVGEEKKVSADLLAYMESENQIGSTSVLASGKEVYDRIVLARKEAEGSTSRIFVLIKAGNRPEIEEHFFKDFLPKMQAWFDQTEEMVKLQKDNNIRDVAEIDTVKSRVQTTMLLLIGLAVIIMIPAGIWVTRQITGPLGTAVTVADAVAAGNLDNTIDVSGSDEAAHLMSALSRMQSDVKARSEAERKVANEALRIKVALDGTSNSVMVADPDGVIVYCNAAALEMMRLAEADIRKDLPAFRASSILGSNFDIYHKNKTHQRNMLAALKQDL